MRLTQVAIDRPIFVAMLFAAVALFGIISLRRLPAELNPRITFPTLTVVTVYPGASPEEVEAVVTKPVEDAVYSVSGVVSVSSRSQENLSLVIMELKLGTALDAAAADARERLDLARTQFPSGVRPPVVGKVDLNAQPVMLVALTGDRYTPRQLRALVERTVQPRLSRVPGVAAVEVTGGDVREVQVTLRRAVLEAHQLALSDVVTGLLAAGANVPGGHVHQPGRDYSVRMIGEFTSLDDLRAAQIPKLPDLASLRGGGPLAALGPSLTAMMGGGSGGGGAMPALPPASALGALLGGGNGGTKRPLTVGEVAEVRDTVQERTTRARVQQRESVGLTVAKLGDANTVAVAEGVRAALAELRSALPGEVRTFVLQDQSVRVLDALHDVAMALALGVLLTIAVVYVFLNDVRGTLIVAVAIPASILATFIPMQLVGFTLNQMTMLGLALSVGILVDDSIVVLENIHRHLEAGLPPREAALRGREEIGLAALAITLVDVIVFVPIALMGGVGGQFFQSFAITAALATLFSLFVSFTLTPAMASRWYRQRQPAAAVVAGGEGGGTPPAPRTFDRLYAGLVSIYQRALTAGLRARGLVLVTGFGALAIAAVAGGRSLEFGLLPVVDSGALRVRLELPPEVSLELTEHAVLEAERAILETSDVRAVYASIGQVTGNVAGAVESGRNLGGLLVSLKPRAQRRLDSVVATELRKRLRNLPGARVSVAPMRGFEGALSPIELQLYGDDLTRLRTAAEAIRARVASLPGILNPAVSLRVGRPELQVTVDRARAAGFDLLVGPAGLALRDALTGNAEVKFNEGGERCEVRVQYDRADRDSPDDVRRIIVGRTSKRAVTVDDIATVQLGAGPTEIARKDRRRLAVVTADLTPGTPVLAMQTRIERELRALSLAGLERKWGGEVEQIAENMLPWLYALGLSVVLVYMVLASLYNSLLQPLTVLSGLPMALVGAIAALLWSGEALTLVAMIGFIMLVGIVGKNGILLVDFTNTLRARGMARNAALAQAGAIRLRPILMTTFTIIFGMLPIAAGLGRGAEIRAPMALVVIGGLALSTLLTLIMVPVLYTLMDDASAALTGRSQEARHDTT